MKQIGPTDNSTGTLGQSHSESNNINKACDSITYYVKNIEAQTPAHETNEPTDNNFRLACAHFLCYEKHALPSVSLVHNPKE